MPYIPHTPGDEQAMLAAIGVASLHELFEEIPAELRCASLAAVPEQVSELEITRLMRTRAAQDSSGLCFIGAGAYLHHIPAAVWDITTRGEYYSAYTPYQAEASQGTLQLLYEFQSMMTSLTGLDVSNASLYDGASALAEAILMAVRGNTKSNAKQILVPRTVHPHYRKVAHTLTKNQGIQLLELPFTAQGTVDMQALASHEGTDIAALVIAQPNFFGSLEDVDALTEWAHARNVLVIALVNPLSLAILKAPGHWGTQGADIACGEGQPLGIPLASGGPYFGFMCCKKALVRQMPGRIIGRTLDMDGKPGYTLTLQAREQHIRRSKATSNICTNQGLMVTAATIYLSLMGAEGLERTALMAHQNAQQLRDKLSAIAGVEVLFNGGANFHEFVLRLPVSVEATLRALAAHNTLGGFNLSHDYPELGEAVLVCATEVHTEADMDKYAEHLERLVVKSTAGNCPIQPNF